MPRDTRYAIKATYAAVKTNTTDVSITPLTSDEKKSTKRYPFINMIKAATSHEIICKKKPKKFKRSVYKLCLYMLILMMPDPTIRYWSLSCV